jgi:CheY-like chemotaxis protein
VVDDAPDALLFIAETLRRSGATVDPAGSVEEALAMFRQNRPDVVISDIAMPDRDGYDMIRAVRELPPSLGGQVPAVALTAYAREEDRLRSLSAGFQVHLAKPVEPTAIVSAVAYARSMTAGKDDAQPGNGTPIHQVNCSQGDRPVRLRQSALLRTTLTGAFFAGTGSGCSLAAGTTLGCTIRLTTSVGQTSTHSPSRSQRLSWVRSIMALPSTIFNTP